MNNSERAIAYNKSELGQKRRAERLAKHKLDPRWNEPEPVQSLEDFYAQNRDRMSRRG